MLTRQSGSSGNRLGRLSLGSFGVGGGGFGIVSSCEHGVGWWKMQNDEGFLRPKTKQVEFKWEKILKILESAADTVEIEKANNYERAKTCHDDLQEERRSCSV